MKRNRFQLFSGSLYVETLRQLRLMGLIYLACCLIFTILPAALSVSRIGGTLPSIDSFAPPLFLFIYVAPVTLAFSAFGYLMRRNASDFYHSLPLTRECMYISRVLAVLTYLIGTIVLSLASVYLLYALLGQAVNWSYLPDQLLYFTTCSLVALGCTLIGLSVTGTYFSAFIVTCLVMFLPRFISVAVSLVIESCAPLVSAQEMGLLFDYSLNLPVAQIANLLSFGTLGGSTFLQYAMRGLSGFAYCGVLGVLYIVLAGILHHYRRSETAMRSAPNRVLQHIYRCALSLPLFLFLGALLVTERSVFVTNREIVLMLLAAALLIYFVYELITTRKLRNLLPALYVLPIVLAISAGIPYAGKIIGERAMHTVPESSAVRSVNLDIPPSRYALNYTELQLERVEYVDAQLNDLLLDALSNTIAYYDNEVYLPGGYIRRTVRLNLNNGSSMTRTLMLSSAQNAQLNELHTNYVSYRNASVKLPDDSEILTMSTPLEGVTAVQDQLLWETFRSEYDRLTDVEKQRLNDGYSFTQPEASIEVAPEAETTTSYTDFLSSGTYLHILLTGVSERESFNASYAITPLTPKTLMMVVESVNQYSADFKDNLSLIADELANAGESEMWIYAPFILYDPTGVLSGNVDISFGVYPDSETFEENHALMQELVALLAAGDTEIDSLDQPIVLVNGLNAETYTEGKAGIGTGRCFLALEPEQMQRLVEILHTLYYSEKG